MGRDDSAFGLPSSTVVSAESRRCVDNLTRSSGNVACRTDGNLIAP